MQMLIMLISVITINHINAQTPTHKFTGIVNSA